LFLRRCLPSEKGRARVDLAFEDVLARIVAASVTRLCNHSRKRVPAMSGASPEPDWCHHTSSLRITAALCGSHGPAFAKLGRDALCRPFVSALCGRWHAEETPDAFAVPISFSATRRKASAIAAPMVIPGKHKEVRELSAVRHTGAVLLSGTPALNILPACLAISSKSSRPWRTYRGCPQSFPCPGTNNVSLYPRIRKVFSVGAPLGNRPSPSSSTRCTGTR